MATNGLIETPTTAKDANQQSGSSCAQDATTLQAVVSGLVPTARAVVDINRPCNAKCRMCYYTHEGSNWSKSLDEVKQELDAAKERGNNSVDFTGGEPTIHPKIVEIIEYAESIGLHTCIITNGLALKRIKSLVEAGCREWLVSIHGLEDKHDEILDVPGAWKKVNETVEFLNQSGCFVRVNCTITKFNAKDLPKLARHYVDFVKPRIVNFINFNPHYDWGKQEQPDIVNRLNEVQVKVSEVAPFLKGALDILNENNIWANVRYFPFCALKGYETHICNNPQVMFDPYEWDYGVTPKTTEAHLTKGRQFQEGIGSKEGTCAECGVRNVCGGVNKNYAKLHSYSELTAYSEKSDYPYHFKKDVEADIIIPVFKSSESLQMLMAEITAKSVPPYNIILVNKQQSSSKNRNCGLERSSSPYVIMVDDDITKLPHGWNRNLVNILKENKEILGLSARLMNQDGTIGKNTANNRDLSQPVVAVGLIPTACCIFRKTDIRFDERFIRAGWEDTDFFMQLHETHGGTCAIANSVPVVHLNEEKNDGGVANQHNEQLFRQKWSTKCQATESAVPNEMDVDKLKAEIVERLEHGDYAAAIPLMEEAIEKGGADAELFNNIGYACWKMGARGQAAEYFCRAAIINPLDKDTLTNLVEACYETGKHTLFEEYLRLMMLSNPNAKEYKFMLAECLMKQEKYEEAEKVLDDVLESNPDYIEAEELLEDVQEAIEEAADVASDEETCCCEEVACESPCECSSVDVIEGKNALAKPDVEVFNNLKYMTRRGCVDVGHVCNINCQFCYHRFENKADRRWLTKDEICHRLERDREVFDLVVTDFTGGEPTLHPDIVDIVKYGNDIGNRICLISHGQWNNLDKIDAIIDAGVHEFLISIHGVKQDHNAATNPGAYEKVMESIEHLKKRGTQWRVNCVATKCNMERFGEYARSISGLSHAPKNANFIVFSPLAGWGSRNEIDFQAKHSELAPHLRNAIEIFTENNIWTNVRYYPMCMLPGLEKHVTCFPQICYDPFEWDYRSYTNMDVPSMIDVYKKGKEAGVTGETEGHIFFNTWSLIQSQRLYRKGPQCISCKLRMICDGVAHQYRDRFGMSELIAQPGEVVLEPIHFRKSSLMAVGGE